MLSKFFKPILLQRPFCAIAGSILGGLLLTQACYYEDMLNSGNSFASQTYQQWQKDTGMTREEIDAALAIAVEQNLIQVDTSTQKHYPELIRFRVNHKVVDAKLSAIGEVVEPEKKEPVAEQPPLPVSQSSAITIPEPNTTTKKTKTRKKVVKERTAEELEIDRIFLPLYLEHKPALWTEHRWIPGDSMKAIKELIRVCPDDAPQRFIDALTWAREGDKSTNWAREAQWGLDNLCTREKLTTYPDAHATAMKNNPEYRARVEGLANSKDIGRVAPGIDSSQITKGQQALNNYMETPKSTVSQEEWDSYA